ncbi:DUF4064 domain-containing protein [Paenibacillus motobuensis]|uniref:DUF4064 domain-containing protein n=1 Tax=Paenibacillus motobuensis TaxID=295324 RepID=A0ABP3I2M3_9BACL
MKRTGEIALSIIGSISGLIMIVVGIVFLYHKDNADYLNYLHANWTDSQVAASLEQMNQAGTLWVLPGGIAAVLGIISIILMKAGDKQKFTGWMLIIVTIITCFISVFGMIPAIFFIIAGIMALVRNPGAARRQSIR